MNATQGIVGAIATYMHADQFGGIGGALVVYAGFAVLFGLIALVPAIASKPAPPKQSNEWVVEESAARRPPRELPVAGETIDGEVNEVRTTPPLTYEDPKWGR